MRASLGLNWRRRSTAAIIAVVACALALTATSAFADAGNPIAGTIKASTVDNGDGTLTVYVRGQWNWLTHTTDCNSDRAATGVGIIWNDSTEPGYTVTKGSISAQVGIAGLRAGDTVNKVDQMVHPVDRGNQSEGYNVAGTDYPAQQQFNDPSTPGITATQLAAWKGGCGRLPQTATASKPGNNERTGQTCANGTSDCSGHPWGSWGYEKTNGGSKPLGYSHTYLKTALPSKVCVNFYDVHGGGDPGTASFQVPNGTKEINADGDNGGASDNSIQTNAYDTTDGANCISLHNTTTTTNIHNASHTVATTVEAGTTVHDSIAVGNGTATAPGGTATLDWFTNNTCTGSPQSTSSALTVTNGQVDATGFSKGPLTTGLYSFKAHYQGDGAGNLTSDGACEPLRVVDSKISITPSSATNHIGDPHVFTAHVDVNDGTGWTNAPAATVVNFSKTGPGSFTAAPAMCMTVGATGSCTITLTSSATGVSTVTASTSVLVSGVSMTRSTDGTGSNSGPATKRWVDAAIFISPSATNHVGDPHTFTVTLLKDIGDGNGFVAAAGEHADVTLTDSNGAAHTAATGTCTNAGANTDANGQCTITFTSPSTGQDKAHASASLSILGSSPFTVSTGSGGLNGTDSVKTFVDAKITIALDATHEVGNSHTFVVTLWQDLGDGNGFVPVSGGHVDYSLVDLHGANGVLDAAASTCDDAGPNTDANGHCTIVLTSATTGNVVASASSTLTVSGVQISVATNGVAPNSGNAQATFVDANIQITPQTATNPLSTNHTLTGHANVDDGSGAGLVNAPDGTTLTFSLTGGPGTFAGPNTCTTAGGTGSCTVDITSSTVGTTTIRAATDVTVSGVALHRETGDANAGDSGDATKHWATARVSIAPDATNEVGDPHTFTVTLEKDTGTGTFVPAAGEQVNVTLTDSNGANHATSSNSCATTDANGRCTITFTSPTAGTVTAHAAASLNIGGAAITAQTNGAGGSSADAVKTFVDANIQITPGFATNPLSTTHTLTGHVNVNDGSGGFTNAPDGTQIDFTLVSGPGSFVGSSSCATSGGTGSCTAVITSSTAGTTVVRAATTVTVGGLNLHRASGDGKAGDSADAQKHWAEAAIAIAIDGTHEVDNTHTFVVTLTKDDGNGGYVPAPGEHVDVTFTDANGAVHQPTGGTCLNAGANTDANGQCTATITSDTPGNVTAHASSTLVVDNVTLNVATNGVAPNSGNAVATFVDANVQITPATANNPIGTTHTLTGHANVNPGTTTYSNAPDGTTITFTMTGPATFSGPSTCKTAGGTGSCSVVIASSTNGASSIKASVDVTLGGVNVHRETGDGQAGDSASAAKLWGDATARTDIMNATGNTLSAASVGTPTVSSGTAIHDKVFVARTAGTPANVPNPTGTVVFHRYSTIDCSGTSVDQTVTLTPGSPSSAISADFAPTADMSFRVEYKGDGNYPARLADCEPLSVKAPASPGIAIVKNPKLQSTAVGGTATFMITVTNSGNTVLTDVFVSDPSTPSCNRTKAQIPALASMAPGATVTYKCTRKNVRKTFNNVATATGTPPSGPNVTATDMATVKVKALTPPKKKVHPKEPPRTTSHKKPKATG